VITKVLLSLSLSLARLRTFTFAVQDEPFSYLFNGGKNWPTTSRCRSTASLLEETKENSLQFLSAGAFNLI
jgi:hypothetical protein